MLPIYNNGSHACPSIRRTEQLINQVYQLQSFCITVKFIVYSKEKKKLNIVNSEYFFLSFILKKQACFRQ